MMKNHNLLWRKRIVAGFSAACLISSANAQQGSFLTLVNLTANDVDVIGEADATAGANGVTFVDTDGAGSADAGVYKITTDTTWGGGKNYILTRKIFVDDGVTLTIEPGTTIYNTVSDAGTPAKADDQFGSIVVTRGGQIVADGSAQSPISFTTIRELEATRNTDIDSDGTAGPAPTRFDRGLWGGLVILGKAGVAKYSAPGTLIGEDEIEGFSPAFSPDGDSDGLTDLIEFGGNEPTDSSGTLRYVSIRHGGYEFAPGDEINGLTLGGVGSGTTLEYIEVMSNSDDGIEFFGGSANLSYALVAFCKDDSFDLDQGYDGNMQFICTIQNPTGDNSASESVQDSDHGGEWDGNDGGNADDVQSAPTIANITFIGDNEGDHAFKFDDFFAGNIYNGAVTGFADLITAEADNVSSDTGSFTNVTTDVANALEATNAAVEGVLASQFSTVADIKLGLVDIPNAKYDPSPAADSPLLPANGASVTDMTAIDSFFVAADYQGAFAPGQNWAAGWTRASSLGFFDFGGLSNLEPDDVDLISSDAVVFDAAAGVNVLNGNQTLDASKTYILRDRLFVTNGNTLTIPAGTKIYSTIDDLGTAAKSDDRFGAIVVTRGSKIMADGTADDPIVMTSINELEAARNTDIDGGGVAANPTRADRGLWGGLVVLGNARVYNYSAPGTLIGENEIEGFAPAFSPDGDADGLTDIIEYGGSNDGDDSGVIRYVSIRHGGYEFAAGDEINGLTLGGVGSGTTLEFIEVTSNSDDGIEFFGGSADLRYALVAFCKDDSFDLDEGYTGRMQFLCTIQNPTDTNSAGESVQDSDHGGEWDGNVKGNADDFQSAPTIANITFIGDDENDHAFKFDDFFAGRIYNGAVTGFGDLITAEADNVSSDTGSFTNVTTDVANALEATNATVEGILAAQFNSIADVKMNKVDIAGALYDPRPADDSELLVANGATVTDMAAIDTWFMNTDYQGAFSSSNNWAAGWTRVDALGHFAFGNLVNLTGDDVDFISSSAVTFDQASGVNILNGDQTLDASKNYILTDRLFVTAGNTLTIPAGTKIYSTIDDLGTSAKSDDRFGSIVVTRGGKIEATGTAAAPIVMTTIAELEAERTQDIDGDGTASLAPTRADRGLWGGLVILGNARVYNYSAPGTLIGENEIEGFAPAFSPDGDSDGLTDIIEYGGDNDADDSGTLRYVSIRHGGYEFAAGDEINGLTLGGVGSGTTLEFIEVLSNSDDGIEFFGGTANIRNAIVAFCKDDSFDLDEGYTGNMQFLVTIQNPTDMNSTGESVQDSDHGGEWDGNVKGNADDFQSAPTIANITFIGDNEGDHAFKFDDFFAGRIYNGAVTGFADLITAEADNVSSDTGSFTNVTTDVPNSLESTNATVEGILAAQFTTVADLGLGQVDIANIRYDLLPQMTSALLAANGAQVTDMTTIDPWFTQTAYQGAFSETENWADGWTGISQLGFLVSGPVDGDEITVTAFEQTGADTYTLTFTGEASTEYQLTSSENLSDGFLTNVTITSGSLTTDAGGNATVEFSSTAAKAFFRLEK